MSKLVSLRFADDELIGWAESYAKERGVSRSRLIELALADYRESCRGGVPDVAVGQDASGDVEAVQLGTPKPRAVSGVVRASALVPTSPVAMDRQRRLNEAAARARVGVPKGKAKG